MSSSNSSNFLIFTKVKLPFSYGNAAYLMYIKSRHKYLSKVLDC